MDTIEKVYCTGHDNNDALLATLASKNNNDPMAMAAMMNGGMNNWCNNPFIYLVWMMFANRFWGNGECGNTTQFDSLRNQMSDNQNSNLLMDAVKGNNCAISQLASNLNCDFNNLNNAICNVRAGIQEVAGNVGFSAERVINAINLGDAKLTSALQNCCCQTQQNIIKMGYENQIATLNQTNELKNSIQYVATGVERVSQPQDSRMHSISVILLDLHRIIHSVSLIHLIITGQLIYSKGIMMHAQSCHRVDRMQHLLLHLSLPLQLLLLDCMYNFVLSPSNGALYLI